jgi:hypothetical protein
MLPPQESGQNCAATQNPHNQRPGVHRPPHLYVVSKNVSSSSTSALKGLMLTAAPLWNMRCSTAGLARAVCVTSRGTMVMGTPVDTCMCGSSPTIGLCTSVLLVTREQGLPGCHQQVHRQLREVLVGVVLTRIKHNLCCLCRKHVEKQADSMTNSVHSTA